MMSIGQVRRAYALSYEDRVAFMRKLVAPYLNKSSRVLDAGCGHQNCLIDPTDVQELIGVDRDPNAIKDNRIISRGIVADLEMLTEIDVGEKVDFVMCIDVVEHLSNPNRFVGAVTKVLKVGGYFFIAAPNKRSMAGMVTAALLRRTIKFLSRIIAGQETPSEAHYYRLNTISSIDGCLRRMGFDDLQFVLFNARMGRRGSMRRFLFFPDYLIGRTGLLKDYSLRILCLARLAVAPPDDGRELNLTLSPGHNGTSAIHK
jgi:SAM-dependent methyltransferase